MNRNVLLLNSSEEIIKVIDWKKAIKLLESGKAKKPYAYNKTYSMPSRRNVFKRDNWTCQYCGFISKNPKSLTIDHVYPKCMGGGTQWTNLVTACPKCNSKKGNKLLKECGMKLKNKPTKPKRLALQLVGLDESGKELWSRWVDLV